MKRLIYLGLVLSLFVFWVIPAGAQAQGLTLKLESGGGASAQIVDNQPGDANGALGVVTFSRPHGKGPAGNRPAPFFCRVCLGLICAFPAGPWYGISKNIEIFF